jgi:hypothetical protein
LEVPVVIAVRCESVTSGIIIIVSGVLARPAMI